jgi:hypothetical protein
MLGIRVKRRGQTLKPALRAVSKVTDIKLAQAAKSNRRNPLLGSEIHIREELINLQEAIETYHLAAGSLHRYPKLYKQIAKEKREILTHCIGLATRMLRKQHLPYTYSRKDTVLSIRKLITLVIDDLERSRLTHKIDSVSSRTMLPYMTVRQFLKYRKRSMHPMAYFVVVLPRRMRLHFA